jgi:primary-amine oxidase
MEKITNTLPFVGGAKKEVAQHPIGPLTASEITRAASILKASWPANTDFNFKAVTLLEPLKAELLPYLQAERSGSTPAKIDRKAFVLYYIRNTVSAPKKPVSER